MDLAKFIDLLQTSELHFSSIRHFRKTDPFEGNFPTKWFDEVIYDNDPGLRQKRIDKFIKIKDMIGNYLISCWHENDDESAAMWKLYLKSDEGIAIRTNREKLDQQLQISEPGIRLHDVRYVDYKQEMPFDPYDGDNWATHKRKSFEHEREVRAIYYDHEREIKAIRYNLAFEPIDSMRVKIPVQYLIDLVAVAPSASDLFLKVVKGLTKSAFPSMRVERSAMDDIP